jgi:hypothetical protein
MKWEVHREEWKRKFVGGAKLSNLIAVVMQRLTRLASSKKI